MTQDNGWISGTSGTTPVIQQDPEMARERYEREATRTHDTADRVIRDIRESYEAGILTDEQYNAVLDSVSEYRKSTLALLRSLYGVTA